MTIICKTEISTKNLTYDGTHKRFIAEASELPNPGRIYDDACDVGYRIRSHKTGKTILFANSNIIRDRDGDIQVWIYRSVDRSIPVELHVLND